VPARSAKKSRPSGANASAVAKLAPIPSGGDCGPSSHVVDDEDVVPDSVGGVERGAFDRFELVPLHATSSVVSAVTARRRRLMR
jgi:hypothetical protein